jgi:transcriptional regulator with PAS, ATPase and Fis domain
LIVQEMTRIKGLVNRMTRAVRFDLNEILGSSPQIKAVKEIAATVALGSASIMIMGESGTGKELFARAIHTMSPRSKGPFIGVNCGAIPETLMESELFGYMEGAFTGALKTGKPGKFELASGGTIFLDEVGDLPLHLQVKLLRVLEEREVERVGSTQPIPVDIRVIAATNRNLEKMMEQGEFRVDLFYRLSVIPLLIPPLRERTGDILEILQFFLARSGRDLGQPVSGVAPEALELLVAYNWPGNVREMQNAVDYAVTMATGPRIELEHLPPRLQTKAVQMPTESDRQIISLEEAESRLIQRALDLYGTTGAGKRQAAEALGIDLATLYRKLKKNVQNAK